MTASPTKANSDDDSEDFVIQTITAQDGTVQDPKSVPSLKSPQKPPGLSNYGDLDSSSSDSSSNSDDSSQNSRTNKQVSAPSVNDITETKQAPKKRKRVRFSTDTKGQSPAKISRVQNEEQVAEAGQHALDEDMAAFEDEVRVLDEGREEADVNLAEIEDERQQALEDHLRIRITNMKERLRGTGIKASVKAPGTLAREDIRTQKKENNLKPHLEFDVADDDDENIDLMTDWTDISMRANNRTSR